MFSNLREVPAKTSKSHKIRIVAENRFWRFLLVNQLLLSIMAVHAQYRATAPLTVDKPRANGCVFKRIAEIACVRNCERTSDAHTTLDYMES